MTVQVTVMWRCIRCYLTHTLTFSNLSSNTALLLNPCYMFPLAGLFLIVLHILYEWPSFTRNVSLKHILDFFFCVILHLQVREKCILKGITSPIHFASGTMEPVIPPAWFN